MGCAESHMGKGEISIQHSVLFLLIVGQTSKCLAEIERSKDKIDLEQPVNRQGDTLLHYAAKKNNQEVVKYLVRRAPSTVSTRNLKGKTPRDLAEDQRVKDLLRRQ